MINEMSNAGKPIIGALIKRNPRPNLEAFPEPRREHHGSGHATELRWNQEVENETASETHIQARSQEQI